MSKFGKYEIYYFDKFSVNDYKSLIIFLRPHVIISKFTNSIDVIARWSKRNISRSSIPIYRYVGRREDSVKFYGSEITHTDKDLITLSLRRPSMVTIAFPSDNGICKILQNVVIRTKLFSFLHAKDIKNLLLCDPIMPIQIR